jgi:hypothetical protein
MKLHVCFCHAKREVREESGIGQIIIIIIITIICKLLSCQEQKEENFLDV